MFLREFSHKQCTETSIHRATRAAVTKMTIVIFVTAKLSWLLSISWLMHCSIILTNKLNPSQTYTATALRPLRDWQFSPIAEVATRSPIGPGEVAEKSATSRGPRCDQISRSQVFEPAQKPGCDWFGVGDRSATNRGPHRDLTATSWSPLCNLF